MPRIKYERLPVWQRLRVYLKFRRMICAARRRELLDHEFCADMSAELALNRTVFDPDDERDYP